MTQASVGITKVKRENTRVIEAVKNGKRLLYCTTSKNPVAYLSLWTIGGLFFFMTSILVRFSFNEIYGIIFYCLGSKAMDPNSESPVTPVKILCGWRMAKYLVTLALYAGESKSEHWTRPRLAR